MCRPKGVGADSRPRIAIRDERAITLPAKAGSGGRLLADQGDSSHHESRAEDPERIVALPCDDPSAVALAQLRSPTRCIELAQPVRAPTHASQGRHQVAD